MPVRIRPFECPFRLFLATRRNRRGATGIERRRPALIEQLTDTCCCLVKNRPYWSVPFISNAGGRQAVGPCGFGDRRPGGDHRFSAMPGACAGLPPPQLTAIASTVKAVPLLNSHQPWKEAIFSEWATGKAVKTDRYLYTEWSSGRNMLFDHSKDPFENVNIAGTPENAKVVKRLRALLRQT